MIAMRRVPVRWVALMTAVFSACLVIAGSAAWAAPPPPDGPPFGPPPQLPPPAPVRVVEVASPVWQFVLVAVAAVALTILVEQLIAHLRPVRPSSPMA